MPRVRRRRKPRGGYTEQERRALLTGIVMHPHSTRFGHPFHGGWNIAAIREAWEAIGADLLVAEWPEPRFDNYRERGPFAERILAGSCE